MMNVILIEDDPSVRDFLERGLRAEGYRVRSARNGVDGFALARDFEKEAVEEGTKGVVLLDIMLPLMTGLEVCQNLRASRSALPILMLTALDATQDRVTGLRMGADDYRVKPFAFEELLARIEALGRRPPVLAPTTGRTLCVRDLALDRATLKVSRAGRAITLTARELALLELLMSAPGRIFSAASAYCRMFGG